ncbi:MAG TPA: type II secretion system protein [Anaeromyxobacteraceae bacterium]|nr:type II secretion system protein [Anaeromyxobacteraceae bacterium]
MRTRGFTLLEVMVALAILASAMLAISEVVSGALRNHERARDLDVATLLARGKMVDLEEKYRTEGFRDTDETDEGTFEEEGHPEFRWTAEVVAPKADDLCTRLLGELLPGADPDAEAEDGGPAQGASAAGLASGGIIQQQCALLVQDVQKGVREVRLTVAWGPEARRESFTVVTHLVELRPTELTR